MRTVEEKTAWIQKMRGFVKQVAALTDAQRVELSAKMPTTTCEGHTLSVRNQCLLAMQSPVPLTVVAGYRQWGKVGRQVRKGQTAAGYIMVPLAPRNEGDEPRANAKDNPLRFRFVPVFDVTQTEPAYAPTDEETPSAAETVADSNATV